jgi:Caspase domain/Putative peptidoglycan binding domain
MRLLLVALSIIGILASSNVARAERRVAFVVGNGAYRSVAALPNPAIDAEAMANLLRGVGFDVVEGTDLTRDQMTERLLEFGGKSQGADLAVFFYAGHGLAVDGSNYLLPVDADIKSEMDVKLGKAINIDVTLDQTMSDAKVKLVFLDACRDNPFAAKIRSAARRRSVNVQAGLAEMKSGEGTLIAFATGPGRTALDGQEGSHSPFTQALITNIAKPGVEIQQAMTQVRAQVSEQTNKAQLPWGHTDLIGVVYLNPGEAPAETLARQAPGEPVVAIGVMSEIELEFWRSIKDSRSAEEFKAYLNSYPNGRFKTLAQSRLASLSDNASSNNPQARSLTNVDRASAGAESDQVTEDQIGLDRGQRRDVQRRLTGLGFDTRVSGTFDKSTRTVIMRWQAARGYPSTGFLNEQQHRALLAEMIPDDDSDDQSAPHHRHEGNGHHYRGGSGFGRGGLFGMMGGLFRHR